MFQRAKYHVSEWLPALKSRNYRLYFFGQGVSLIGTWMAAVAQQWLLYPTLTNNKSLLGVASAVNAVPTIVLLLYAGVIADRTDRRIGILVQQVLYALVTFMLFFLVSSGTIQVWHVFVATFLTGAVFAFDMPTRQALMIELVDKKHIASAIALNTGIFNTARVIGPTVAGLLIASIGIAPAFFINGVSFVAVIASVLLMNIPRYIKIEQSDSVWGQLKSGALYIREHQHIWTPLLILFLLSLFTGPLVTFLPVFAKDIFRVGEVGFGLLQAAFGLGAVVGSFGFSKLYQAITDKHRFLAGLLIIISLSMAGFSYASLFILALGAIFLGGWGGATLMTLVRTAVHEQVPNHLRGRLVSYYSLVLIGGTPIGALLGSVGVGTIGIRLTVLLSAIFFGVTTLILIKNLDKRYIKFI